jgi:hypothetical protein
VVAVTTGSGLIWGFISGGREEWERIDTWSEAAGDRAGWLTKPVAAFVGELECVDGVGRFLGDAADDWVRGAVTGLAPGSIFGAMLEFDLRD